MAFGDIAFSVAPGGNFSSAAGLTHTGRGVHINLSTATSGVSFYRTDGKTLAALSVGFLYLHYHRQRGHRNAYALNAIGSTNVPQRLIGTATNIVRAGGPNNVFNHIEGRRVYLGGTVATYYDLISRANLRTGYSGGLTTPIAIWYAEGRYYYAVHNTNQLVRVEKRSQKIVSSATAPGSAWNVADGLCATGHHLVYVNVSNDTLYLLRAA